MTVISWLVISALVVGLGFVAWRFWSTRYQPPEDPTVEGSDGLDGPLPTELPPLVEVLVRQMHVARSESSLARHALERRVLNMEKLLFGFAVTTAALGVVAVIAVSASHNADLANMRQDRRDAIDANQRCVAGNDTRVAVVGVGAATQAEIDGILNGLSALSPKRPQTADEQQLAAASAKVIKDNRDAFLGKLDVPGLQSRDCTSLYPLPKRTS